MVGQTGESEAQQTRSFDSFCAYLRRASGLVLDADKRYLVESRVSPVMKRAGVTGLGELVRVLEQGQMPSLAREVVQAMTINETYFFRDRVPFEILRESVLPGLIAARSMQRRLRIWCAASSTGQEAYSISMILDEFGTRLAGWRLEIIATDLSEAALAKAKAATYSQFEVQRGLSTAQLLRYFDQVGDMWRLKEATRSRVDYRHFNLLSDYSALGSFDLIFCRNVLIYFEPDRKADVLNRMTKLLAADGALALGSSESIIGLNTKLKQHPSFRGYFVHAAAERPKA
jgi:chemotaxis protein methyltransferase CheR